MTFFRFTYIYQNIWKFGAFNSKLFEERGILERLPYASATTRHKVTKNVTKNATTKLCDLIFACTSIGLNYLGNDLNLNCRNLHGYLCNTCVNTIYYRVFAVKLQNKMLMLNSQ